ncbi:hypothetical protein D3C80_1668780 [compost metagenome]
MVARKVQVELASGVAEGWLAGNRLAQGAAVGEVEMQADAALEQRLLRQLTSGVESGHVGHGGGGADHPGLKGPQDDCILVRAEAEIVSVDDDLTRHVRPPWGVYHPQVFSHRQAHGHPPAWRARRAVAV